MAAGAVDDYDNDGGTRGIIKSATGARAGLDLDRQRGTW